MDLTEISAKCPSTKHVVLSNNCPFNSTTWPRTKSTGNACPPVHCLAHLHACHHHRLCHQIESVANVLAKKMSSMVRLLNRFSVGLQIFTLVYTNYYSQIYNKNNGNPKSTIISSHLRQSLRATRLSTSLFVKRRFVASLCSSQTDIFPATPLSL